MPLVPGAGKLATVCHWPDSVASKMKPVLLALLPLNVPYKLPSEAAIRETHAPRHTTLGSSVGRSTRRMA
jgi:hypothetical protein